MAVEEAAGKGAELISIRPSPTPAALRASPSSASPSLIIPSRFLRELSRSLPSLALAFSRVPFPGPYLPTSESF